MNTIIQIMFGVMLCALMGPVSFALLLACAYVAREFWRNWKKS